MNTSMFARELKEHLRSMLSRPALFGVPQAVEGRVIAYVEMLLAFQEGSSLADVGLRVLETCRALTADAPQGPCQAMMLCEETGIPERRVSYHRLQQKGRELCQRLLRFDPLK